MHRLLAMLVALLPLALLAPTGGRAQESTPSAPPSEVQQIADDTYAFVSGGYVSLFIVTDEGVIATAAVDMESGMTLAAKSNRADFDLSVASAYNSELVKQKLKIIRALNLKSTLEDMLLTLGDQFHLIKVLPGGSSFMYLAADRSSTNLAILRIAVSKHCSDLT